MSNRLAALLKTDTLSRKPSHYEQVFDDFVRFAGGRRVSERVAIPPGYLNADYYFEFDDLEIVLELKQVNAYRATKTVDEYFAQLLRERRVSHFESLGNRQIRISPASLTRKEWERFYRNFRPRVPEHLKKAAQQLKSTDALLPEPRSRRVRGVMLVNTGDYNLPTDLLFRIVHNRLRREWKGGRWRSIEFAGCWAMVDMFREGQHPFLARHIARALPDAVLESAPRYLYDRWIHYGAAAIGHAVEFEEGATAEEPVPNLSQRFQGKIMYRPTHTEADVVSDT